MSETPVDNGRGPSVGNFRVSFQVLERPYGRVLDGEYISRIGLVGDAFETVKHEDGTEYKVLKEAQPKVSNKQPYEGTLTDHELRWLLSLPGLEYNLAYRFNVEPIDEAAKAAIAALQ